MRCDEVRRRIDMLHDGELPAGEREALSEHIAQCADCARYRDELGRLRGRLRQARETAPVALLERVRAGLEVEVAEAADERSPSLHRPLQAARAAVVSGLLSRLQPYARQMAAVLVACAISIAGTAWWLQQAETAADIAHDVLAAHMRALLQDNTVQVASLDTHTVKPWFAGRLEYTPLVKDLSSEGFALVGGRLDYVDGQRVAALVYRHRLHQISVFIWPADGGGGAVSHTVVNGYNLLSWSEAGMSFWAVSDLNAGELSELQALL